MKNATNRIAGYYIKKRTVYYIGVHTFRFTNQITYSLSTNP